ncbi:hypothetical protein Tco_0191033 [Tanacetum coccineum]
MADNRTIRRLLEAPTEGYEDAIVIAITTRSGVSYNGTQVPPPPSSLPKVVERETEVTKDTVPPTNNGSTKDVQPLVVQVETHVPIFEPVVAPVSAPKPNPKPSIPYPSRLNDQKIREKAKTDRY